MKRRRKYRIEQAQTSRALYGLCQLNVFLSRDEPYQKYQFLCQETSHTKNTVLLSRDKPYQKHSLFLHFLCIHLCFSSFDYLAEIISRHAEYEFVQIKQLHRNVLVFDVFVFRQYRTMENLIKSLYGLDIYVAPLYQAYVIC